MMNHNINDELTNKKEIVRFNDFEITKIINDDTSLGGKNNKKYKTIGELLKAPISSIPAIASSIKDNNIREFLFSWLNEHYYSKIQLIGNLTLRLSKIANRPCYEHLMKTCFDNVDILNSNKTIEKILDENTMTFIKKLHIIDPSITGSFLDYLTRRIVCEIIDIQFTDDRSDVIITARLTKNDDNKCYTLFNGGKSPVCRFDCYNKTNDTKNYKSIDILLEIFITSLSHSEAFGQCPVQEKIDEMVKIIQNIDNLNEVIYPLYNVCNNLLNNTEKNVLINPSLGHKIDGMEKSIPADCDIVIDNNLFDIKCTNCGRKYNEILQLLGYSALLCLRPTKSRKVSNIGIINLLQGEIINYNVDYITKENYFRLLQFLTNSTEGFTNQENNRLSGF